MVPAKYSNVDLAIKSQPRLLIVSKRSLPEAHSIRYDTVFVKHYCHSTNKETGDLLTPYSVDNKGIYVAR